MGSVGTPHVRLRSWSSCRSSLLSLNNVHCRTNRCKILNWLATMWGGRIRFTTPMLYATAVVAMFTIGGLSGVTHSLAAADSQQTDTYYIVAHFHYVIFGGIILGFFGGFYFWWPKYSDTSCRGKSENPVLGHGNRFQPNIRPHAHIRPPRNEQKNTNLLLRTGF